MPILATGSAREIGPKVSRDEKARVENAKGSVATPAIIYMEGAAYEALRQYALSVDLHKKLRSRLLAEMTQAPPGSLLAFKGAPEKNINDSDTEYNFYQDSNVFYLFGVEEPSVNALLLKDSEEVILIIKHHDDMTSAFMGNMDPSYFSLKYNCRAYYEEELDNLLGTLSISKVYLTPSNNTSHYSDLKEKSLPWDETYLQPILTECRMVKIPEEIYIIRKMCKSASLAHLQLMRNCKPGVMEYNLAGTFQGYAAQQWGHGQAFPPICGSGKNASVLHYPYNRKRVEDGDMVVCDMGTQGYGYNSDITISIPANGRFTQKQREVYNIVLNANLQVMSQTRPGTRFRDLHTTALRIIMKGLIDLGIITCTVDEALAIQLQDVFMPHYLGHHLGLDTHDVGMDYLFMRNYSPVTSLLSSDATLRTGMILTNEPGIYFMEFLINKALQGPQGRFLNVDKINEYQHVGGVRIEDDVLVTNTGFEKLSNLPRSTEDIENFMLGGDWKIDI
jgi:Xaa-Pro dipeptidase